MRVLLAGAMIALLAGPACAQDKHVPRYGDTDKEKSAVEKAADREAEQAYKRSLGNIPDKGPTDPWGNVRSESTPKPVAKASQAKRAKTSNAN